MKHQHITKETGDYCITCGKRALSPYWWTNAIYAVLIACYLGVCLFAADVVYMDGPRYISPLYAGLSNFFLSFGLFFVAGGFIAAGWACLKAAFKATRSLDFYSLCLLLTALALTVMMWFYVSIGGMLIG